MFLLVFLRLFLREPQRFSANSAFSCVLRVRLSLFARVGVPCPVSSSPKSPSPDPHADPADLPFEDALAKLEEIIERMEQRDAGLEESLQGYEQGVRLIRRCRDVLKQAETRVEELNKMLQKDAAGGGAGGGQG